MRLCGVLAALVTVVACASQSENVACTQRDWYELGRRDGAQGASMDRMAALKQECGGSFSSDWETVYVNGRNAGLVDYCAPENGYELGRSGIAYLYVCPSTIEPTFLNSYRRGQEARQLELKQKELDARIDSLTDQLDKASTRFERTRLADELNQLQRLRARNERELTRVSK
ncbi:MAG: DUF2799 domain-containing protein [Bdellovibrionales bacterium]